MLWHLGSRPIGKNIGRDLTYNRRSLSCTFSRKNAVKQTLLLAFALISLSPTEREAGENSSALHHQVIQTSPSGLTDDTLSSPDHERITRFESQIRFFQELLKIPGISAGIVKDQRLVWAKGFGYADYKKTEATPATPYQIASVSKTFGATLLMQLVESGKVSLDDPMSKYSDQYKSDLVKVRHVLTHTSEGDVPGEHYEYNGDIFENLFDVIVKGSGKRYRLLLSENILQKLKTADTSPGNDLDDPDANHMAMIQLLGADNEKNYVEALRRMAKSYRLYGDGEIVQTSDYRRGLGPSNGIVSSVVDLAKYDAALDSHLFLRKETQELMWTPAVSTKGDTLPYGYGWFTQKYRGLRLIWHNGNLPDLYSSLIVKVPEKHITLILLANSDALSSPFKLALGDITRSVFACGFLRLFVFENALGVRLPEPDWRLGEKELAAEIQDLETQGRGYTYDRELQAYSAAREWLGRRKEGAHTEVKLEPGALQEFAGQYRAGKNEPFSILREGDGLVRAGRTRIELFPMSPTDFFAKSVDAVFTFIRDASGRVSKLRITRGGDVTIAERIK